MHTDSLQRKLRGVRFAQVKPEIRAVDARKGKAIGGCRDREGGWDGFLPEIRGGAGTGEAKVGRGSAMVNRKGA